MQPINKASNFQTHAYMPNLPATTSDNCVAGSGVATYFSRGFETKFESRQQKLFDPAVMGIPEVVA